jgi:hypothetical protein
MSPAQPAYKQGYLDNSEINQNGAKTVPVDEFPNQSYRHTAGNPRINRHIDMEDWREDSPVAKQGLTLQLDEASFPIQQAAYTLDDHQEMQVGEVNVDQHEVVGEDDYSVNNNKDIHQNYQPHAGYTKTNLHTASTSGKTEAPFVNQPKYQQPIQQPNSAYDSGRDNDEAGNLDEYDEYQENMSADDAGDVTSQIQPESTDSYEDNVPQFLQGGYATTNHSAGQVKPEAAHNNRRRIVIFSGFGALLVIAVAVIAWPGSRNQVPVNPDSLPIITADATPIRAKPVAGEGNAQDLQIYQGITGSNTNPERVETLLPGPENPMNPGEQVAGNPNSGDGNPSNVTGVSAGNTAGASMATIVMELPPLKPAAQNAGLQTPVVNNANSNVVNNTQITSGPVGIYYAQLASVRSPDGAQAAATKFERDLSAVLGTVKMQVKKVDLGANKGFTYRVVAGPVADRNTANVLCQNIKNKGQDCIVASMP